MKVDKSNEYRESHPENIPSIVVTPEVSNFEISKDSNEWQYETKSLIFLTLYELITFKFKEVNIKELEIKYSIFVTFDKSILEKSNRFKFE